MANGKVDRVKVAAETVKDWTEHPELSDMQFDSKVRDYRAAHITEKLAKDTKDQLKGEIQLGLLVAEETKLKVGKMTAILSKGRTASYIDAHLLAAAGVDPDVIMRCTVEGTEYDYIQVIEEKEGKGVGRG